MIQTNTRRLGKLAALAFAGTLSVAPMAMAQMKGSFAAADVDHNGRVTLPEFEAYATQMLNASNGFRAQRFRAMTPQQQQAALEHRFHGMDHGNKGYLDQNDWNAG